MLVTVYDEDIVSDDVVGSAKCHVEKILTILVFNTMKTLPFLIAEKVLEISK